MHRLVEFDSILGIESDSKTVESVEENDSNKRGFFRSIFSQVFSNDSEAVCSTTDQTGDDSDQSEEVPQISGKSDRNYWMSDSLVKNCYDCGKSFSTIRRRHHCRFCGQIFCWKCAPVRAPPINKRS